MTRNSELVGWRQIVLREFASRLVQRRVGRDEFCSLLLSRRPLERCNDEVAHCRGLFDPRSGELFHIRESDLYSRT